MGVHKKDYGNWRPILGSHYLGNHLMLQMLRVSSFFRSVDRIWGILGSYCTIPKAIFYLLGGTIVHRDSTYIHIYIYGRSIGQCFRLVLTSS